VAEFLGVAAVVLGFAAIMAGLAGLGRRIRQRGRAGGQAFMGPFEELWHPSAHRARLATEIVDERMLPGPATDDQPRAKG
jgi:hypothetical protein